MTKEQFNKQKWHKNMMCRVMSRVGIVVGVDFQQSTISIIFEDKQDEVYTYAYHYVTLMEQQGTFGWS